jgi:hypothetical protein
MQKLLNELQKAGLKLDAIKARVFCDLCGVAVVGDGLQNVGACHLARGYRHRCALRAAAHSERTKI